MFQDRYLEFSHVMVDTPDEYRPLVTQKSMPTCDGSISDELVRMIHMIREQLRTPGFLAYPL